MPEVTDQTGRKIQLQDTPKRIVSSVPSQTELLYDLGLEKEVLGITAYCVHPPHWLKQKLVVGGTKDLKIKNIIDLKPDLIVANKEENNREQIEKLAEVAPVYVSDIKTPQDALDMISDLGILVGRPTEATKLVQQIEQGLADLNSRMIEGTSLYFMWKDPYMVVSNDTFIQSMVGLTGLKNALTEVDGRYPEVSLEDMANLQPDVIFLSSEPYRFTTRDMHQMATYFPNSIVKLIDGEMMSWYGSRLVKSMKYVQGLGKEVGLIMMGKSA